MKDIIERLEKLTGPDRVADHDIWMLFGIGWSPHYTESVDDAMTPVSAGDHIVAIHQLPRTWVVQIGSRKEVSDVTDVEARTLPTTIARLRATPHRRPPPGSYGELREWRSEFRAIPRSEHCRDCPAIVKGLSTHAYTPTT